MTNVARHQNGRTSFPELVVAVGEEGRFMSVFEMLNIMLTIIIMFVTLLLKYIDSN